MEKEYNARGEKVYNCAINREKHYVGGINEWKKIKLINKKKKKKKNKIKKK